MGVLYPGKIMVCGLEEFNGERMVLENAKKISWRALGTLKIGEISEILSN